MASRIEGLADQSEAIRRSLSTMSLEFKQKQELDRNLMSLIESTIAKTIQETLAQTLSEQKKPYTHPETPPSISRTVTFDDEATTVVTPEGFPEGFYDCAAMELDVPKQPTGTTTTTMTSLRFRRYQRFETLFGVVLVWVCNETTNWDMYSGIEQSPRAVEFEAGATFIPAPWLFRTAFAASFIRQATRGGGPAFNVNLTYHSVVEDGAEIMEYSRLGHVMGVRQLLQDRKASLSDRDEQGRTALHVSAPPLRKPCYVS